MTHQNLHLVIGSEWLWFLLLVGMALLGIMFVLGYVANRVDNWLTIRRNEKRLTEIWKNRTRPNLQSK